MKEIALHCDTMTINTMSALVGTSISTWEIRNTHRLQYKSCLLCSNINLIYAINFVFMVNKTLFEKMKDQKKLSLISGMFAQKC
jgi:hypothetical protein